jgi:predicted transcriptional regulator
MKADSKPPAKTQGIKLDDSVRQRLKTLGERRGRSPHWLMRNAIETYLDREEKYEQEKQEDAARWENYQNTGHAIDHDRAAAWLSSLAEGKRAKCPH